MTKEAASIFEAYSDGEVCRNYSGRGMYGEQTTGMVYNSEKEFYKAVAEIMQSEDSDERAVVSQALRKIRTDSMGLGTIFY